MMRIRDELHETVVEFQADNQVELFHGVAKWLDENKTAFSSFSTYEAEGREYAIGTYA